MKTKQKQEREREGKKCHLNQENDQKERQNRKIGRARKKFPSIKKDDERANEREHRRNTRIAPGLLADPTSERSPSPNRFCACLLQRE